MKRKNKKSQNFCTESNENSFVYDVPKKILFQLMLLFIVARNEQQNTKWKYPTH